MNNDGRYIFASNLVGILNHAIFNKSIWLTEDDNTTIVKENCKQGFESSDEAKYNNSIDNNNNVISQENVAENCSDFWFNLRVKNVNKLIIGNSNINSISSKLD